MLENFLKTQAAELLSRRRRDVAETKTAEQIAARQKKLKAFFIRSLGDFPERTPLNPRIVGSRQYPGYRIERILFESRPGHLVTALLYMPVGKPPFPGVLVPCGHSANGKAADTYQRVCILLAKSGMAAFCYDPIGQGERVQKLDADGGNRGAAGRPPGSVVSDLGWNSSPGLPVIPAGDRPRPPGLHR
jgi:hypothetical protein